DPQRVLHSSRGFHTGKSLPHERHAAHGRSHGGSRPVHWQQSVAHEPHRPPRRQHAERLFPRLTDGPAFYREDFRRLRDSLARACLPVRKPSPPGASSTVAATTSLSRNCEIGRFLHLKSEIRNCKLDYANCDSPI